MLLRNYLTFKPFSVIKRMTYDEAVLKCWALAQIAVSQGILLNGSPFGEVGFCINGFAKSGTGSLVVAPDNLPYRNAGFRVVLKTRYNQEDVIDTFDDIADVAWQWNTSGESGRDGCFDENWANYWEKTGRITKHIEKIESWKIA